ncbi:MAG TPA: type II toxin-antitoxin system VapC family toxin [Vicinamibacterales bacterium]|nr:type II toxin-antitoxin system VapC family toxin [Vicinamibacterales bacterium]
MELLLDTDTGIEVIHRRSDRVLRKLTPYTSGDIAISSVTLAELSFGVQRSSQPEKTGPRWDVHAPLEFSTSMRTRPAI